MQLTVEVVNDQALITQLKQEPCTLGEAVAEMNIGQLTIFLNRLTQCMALRTGGSHAALRGVVRNELFRADARELFHAFGQFIEDHHRNTL